MRRIILVLAALVGLTSQSLAANSTVSAMTAASAFGGTELLYIVQGAADRKGTPAQMATYVYSLASGDCTISSAGAVVCTKTNGTAFSALATTTPGTGIATWLATPSSANLLAALTTKTGTGNAVFGSAPTIDSLNATTAATLAFITGSTQCLQVNTSGAISGTGSACGSGSAGVSSIAGNTGAFTLNSASGLTNATNDIKCQAGSASQFGCVEVDGTTIKATAGVISAPPLAISRTVTGATDTILSTDLGNVVYYNSASAVAITQPAPTGSFAAGFFTTLCNINAGLPTVTPGSGNIGGAGTFALPIVGTASNPACASYQSDGTNFNLVPSYNLNASIFTAGTVPAARLPFGTGVGTAAAATLSSAGGLTSTIFHGTATLGTSAIASGACATAVNVTATNVATTDVVTAGFSADPTATTGYLPTAMLTIVPYVVSAGNIGVKVCNLTGSSITPSAVTINVSAVR